MKRRGKSPPPRAQARGHEKPHAVQDRTGGIGSPAQHAAQAATPSGYWSQSARTPPRRKAWSETNDRPGVRRKPPAGQNPAYSHHSAGALRQRGAPGLFVKKILPLKLVRSNGCDFFRSLLGFKFLVNLLPLPAMDTRGKFGFKSAVSLPPNAEAFQKKTVEKDTP